ncbi:UNVERIFIED_CONTAM: hypothetical protein Scaly_1062100 [Sesamum calycinum]|uniref:Aminotransferase-like plant mobile domain-containing protein n=1 Tax=Sesamum calycinum TaxID=2727403 RepID=A0AAW2QM00_9LAMI
MAVNFLESLLTSGFKFWFRRDTKYCESPPRKEKKAVRPKSTHNPSKAFGVHGQWSTADEALLSKLGIEGSLKEQMFLAAYFACWFCVFTLPIDVVSSIRPNTFRGGEYHGSLTKVGLVVPVLASIYKGLNKVSNSSRPTHVHSPFPIHFVYSWIAHYFRTHYQVLQGVRGPKMTLFSVEEGAKYYDPQEARKRLHKGDFVSWTCNMIAKDKDFSFVDDGHAKEFEEVYFMAILSNFLPLRQSGQFAIELYSPHRFSRQFGFLKKMSGILSQDIHKASLEDGTRYWRLCTLSKTMEKVLTKDKERGKGIVQDAPHEHVGYLPPKSNSRVVESIEKMKFDAEVEDLLDAFIAKAVAYDEARSSTSEELSKGLPERQLKEPTLVFKMPKSKKVKSWANLALGLNITPHLGVGPRPRGQMSNGLHTNLLMVSTSPQLHLALRTEPKLGAEQETDRHGDLKSKERDGVEARSSTSAIRGRNSSAASCDIVSKMTHGTQGRRGHLLEVPIHMPPTRFGEGHGIVQSNGVPTCERHVSEPNVGGTVEDIFYSRDISSGSQIVHDGRGLRSYRGQHGGIPMEVWCVVLYQYSTRWRNLLHCLGSSSTKHRKYVSSTRLMTSVGPSVYG